MIFESSVSALVASRHRVPLCTCDYLSASQTSTQDGSSDGSTSIRVIAARQSSSVPPPSAPAMAREQSGGHYVGRRGTAGRKPSPAGLEAQTQADNAGKETRRTT